MKGKKLFFLTFLIFVFSLIYFFNQKNKKPRVHTKIEKEQVSKKRNPSSIKVTPPKKTKVKSYKKERKIVANTDIVPSKINYTNSVNPKWKNKLKTSYMRFHSKGDMKLNIKHVKSILEVDKKNNGRNLEIVTMTFRKEGEFNRFKALVDSETGKVLRTWDRTIHMNKNELTLKPMNI